VSYGSDSGGSHELLKQNDLLQSGAPGNSGQGGHKLPKTRKIPKQATGGLPVAAGRLAASD